MAWIGRAFGYAAAFVPLLAAGAARAIALASSLVAALTGAKSTWNSAARTAAVAATAGVANTASEPATTTCQSRLRCCRLGCCHDQPRRPRLLRLPHQCCRSHPLRCSRLCRCLSHRRRHCCHRPRRRRLLHQCRHCCQGRLRRLGRHDCHHSSSLCSRHCRYCCQSRHFLRPHHCRCRPRHWIRPLCFPHRRARHHCLCRHHCRFRHRCHPHPGLRHHCSLTRRRLWRGLPHPQSANWPRGSDQVEPGRGRAAAVPAATMRRCRHQRAITVSRDGTPNLSVRPLRPGMRTEARQTYAAYNAETRWHYHIQDERERSNHLLCQALNLAMSVGCLMRLADAVARLEPTAAFGTAEMLELGPLQRLRADVSWVAGT